MQWGRLSERAALGGRDPTTATVRRAERRSCPVDQPGAGLARRPARLDPLGAARVCGRGGGGGRVGQAEKFVPAFTLIAGICQLNVSVGTRRWIPTAGRLPSRAVWTALLLIM